MSNQENDWFIYEPLNNGDKSIVYNVNEMMFGPSYEFSIINGEYKYESHTFKKKSLFCIFS